MATAAEIKQAKQRWAIRQQEISSFGSVSVSDSKQQQAERIARAREDYAFFVSYYFPHYTMDKQTGKSIPSAPFHIAAANYIRSHHTTRAVFEWARGHAKSTHMGVFIPMWLMAQEKPDIHMVVLVSKSEQSAIDLIADLQAELQYNERYAHDFGKQYNAGQWEAGRFTTLGTKVSFVALGRGQSPRGLKKTGCRPDYIIIDDLDDDELCLNEDRVRRATAWVEDALFPTQGAEGGRFIMVGNLISKNSVLYNISQKDGTHLTRVDIRNAQGRPSWPVDGGTHTRTRTVYGLSCLSKRVYEQPDNRRHRVFGNELGQDTSVASFQMACVLRRPIAQQQQKQGKLDEGGLCCRHARGLLLCDRRTRGQSHQCRIC